MKILAVAPAMSAFFALTTDKLLVHLLRHFKIQLVEDPLTLGNESLFTGVCSSRQTITAESIIGINTDVDFIAKNSISLNSGFNVEAGAVFTASIADCSLAAFSENILSPIALEVANTVPIRLEPIELLLHSHPASNETIIEFYLSERAPVFLEVYDIAGLLLGRIIDNTTMDEGRYTRQFDTDQQYLSGIYMIVLHAADLSITKSLVVLP